MHRMTVALIAIVLIAIVGCSSADHGRRPAEGGTVYDALQRVYWLADANLAGDAGMRAALGVAGVNANGTMDYATAVRWVAALNAFDGGAGHLGHHDWQLPVNPPDDPTCAVAEGNSGNSFGPGCTASALGRLFATTLGGSYPEGIGGPARTSIGPLRNVQQGLYWTSGVREVTPWDSNSAYTFTFTSGTRGRNTTRANYFFVLPVVHGAIGTSPAGTGLLPYTSGPAAGLAIFDAAQGVSWPVDADLAASSRFGLDGTAQLQFQTGNDRTVPLIAKTGGMRFETARDWLARLNATAYAGASTWTLPTVEELLGLYAALGLDATPDALLAAGEVGGFHHLQSFFYWACQRDQAGDSRSVCNGANPGPSPNGTGQMQWAFNFQSGFQSTDEEKKQFFVVPYFPAR
jgi:hypothetical protein